MLLKEAFYDGDGYAIVQVRSIYKRSRLYRRELLFSTSEYDLLAEFMRFKVPLKEGDTPFYTFKSKLKALL